MSGEGAFWAWLRGGFLPVVDQAVRIESFKDIPDLEACVAGRTFWAELKSCERPARPTTALDYDLTQGQALWLKSRREAGGAAWLLVRVGFRGRRACYLVDGAYAEQFVERPMEEDLASSSVLLDSTVGAREIVLAMAGLDPAHRSTRVR